MQDDRHRRAYPRLSPAVENLTKPPVTQFVGRLFFKVKIPLPPLEIQKQLVAEAEKEEEIIAANRRLIETMERKIAEVLSEV